MKPVRNLASSLSGAVCTRPIVLANTDTNEIKCQWVTNENKLEHENRNSSGSQPFPFLLEIGKKIGS